MASLLRGKSITSLIVALVLLLITSLFPATRAFLTPAVTKPTATNSSSSGQYAPLTNGFYDVQRVVDGDTLILCDARGVLTRVRFIGVDTPETVKPDTPQQPFGHEATEYTKRLISESHSRVRIELDGPTTDRFERALAHIYVTALDKRELLLSEELLRHGLARTMLGFPYSEAIKTRLHAAESEARERRRNLWSGNAPEGDAL